MGAVPSHETHQRGLYSHRHGRNRRSEIILIPLTSQFFPSPDCPLFQHLYAARYRRTAKYYFRALRSAAAAPESDYFCTSTKLSEPDEFSRFNAERLDQKRRQGRGEGQGQAAVEGGGGDAIPGSSSIDNINSSSRDATVGGGGAAAEEDDGPDGDGNISRGRGAGEKSAGDYQFQSFTDTPEGLYRVLIAENDLCVFDTDEELRQAYARQVRHQRRQHERMTTSSGSSNSNNNNNMRRRSDEGMGGSTTAAAAAAPPSQQQQQQHGRHRSFSSSSAHASPRTYPQDTATNSNDNNNNSDGHCGVGGFDLFENVSYESFLSGYVAAQRYAKGARRHTMTNPNVVDGDGCCCGCCSCSSGGVCSSSGRVNGEERENKSSNVDAAATGTDCGGCGGGDMHTAASAEMEKGKCGTCADDDKNVKKARSCCDNGRRRCRCCPRCRHVTSPAAYYIRPIPCAIASRWDASKPPPVDDPLYVKFDNFYVKIMGMFGLFPSTVAMRTATGRRGARPRPFPRKEGNPGGGAETREERRQRRSGYGETARCCTGRRGGGGGGEMNDINSSSSSSDDDEEDANPSMDIAHHLLKGTMFVDKDVGDQILGNMVMLAVHMYVRQCVKARIQPRHLPMQPFFMRFPMSNIPMLQFLREFRVRLRTLLEAGTAKSGQKPMHVGMSGFNPMDVAEAHNPHRARMEETSYLFEDDVPKPRGERPSATTGGGNSSNTKRNSASLSGVFNASAALHHRRSTDSNYSSSSSAKQPRHRHSSGGGGGYESDNKCTNNSKSGLAAAGETGGGVGFDDDDNEVINEDLRRYADALFMSAAETQSISFTSHRNAVNTNEGGAFPIFMLSGFNVQNTPLRHSALNDTGRCLSRVLKLDQTLYPPPPPPPPFPGQGGAPAPFAATPPMPSQGGPGRRDKKQQQPADMLLQQQQQQQQQQLAAQHTSTAASEAAKRSLLLRRKHRFRLWVEDGHVCVWASAAYARRACLILAQQLNTTVDSHSVPEQRSWVLRGLLHAGSTVPAPRTVNDVVVVAEDVPSAGLWQGDVLRCCTDEELLAKEGQAPLPLPCRTAAASGGGGNYNSSVTGGGPGSSSGQQHPPPLKSPTSIAGASAASGSGVHSPLSATIPALTSGYAHSNTSNTNYNNNHNNSNTARDGDDPFAGPAATTAGTINTAIFDDAPLMGSTEGDMKNAAAAAAAAASSSAGGAVGGGASGGGRVNYTSNHPSNPLLQEQREAPANAFWVRAAGGLDDSYTNVSESNMPPNPKMAKQLQQAQQQRVKKLAAAAAALNRLHAGARFSAQQQQQQQQYGGGGGDVKSAAVALALSMASDFLEIDRREGTLNLEEVILSWVRVASMLSRDGSAEADGGWVCDPDGRPVRIDRFVFRRLEFEGVRFFIGVTPRFVGQQRRIEKVLGEVYAMERRARERQSGGDDDDEEEEEDGGKNNTNEGGAVGAKGEGVLSAHARLLQSSGAAAAAAARLSTPTPTPIANTGSGSNRDSAAKNAIAGDAANAAQSEGPGKASSAAKEAAKKTTGDAAVLSMAMGAGDAEAPEDPEDVLERMGFVPPRPREHHDKGVEDRGAGAKGGPADEQQKPQQQHRTGGAAAAAATAAVSPATMATAVSVEEADADAAAAADDASLSAYLYRYFEGESAFMGDDTPSDKDAEAGAE